MPSSSSSFLLTACVDGDLERVQEAIDKDQEVVNQVNLVGSKEPALIFCIKNGRFKIADYLLSLSNIDVNVVDGNDRSALHEAANIGGDQALATVRKLLAKRAKVDKDDCNGRTPVWEALVNNHVEIGRLLIEEGLADHRIVDPENESTALINCAGHGHLETIQMLISLRRIDKSDLEYRNHADAGSVCALDVAFMTGRLDVAKCLMQHYQTLKLPFPKTSFAAYLLGLDPETEDVISGVEQVAQCFDMAKELKADPGEPLNWGGVTVYALQIVMTLEDSKNVQALGKWLFDKYGAPPEEGEEGIETHDDDEEALRILDHLKISGPLKPV